MTGAAKVQKQPTSSRWREEVHDLRLVGRFELPARLEINYNSGLPEAR